MTDAPPAPPSYDEPPPPETSNGADPYATPEPNDVHAERSVIGSMLITPTAIVDCLDAVKPHDFYRIHHEQIFDAILHLYAESVPVDAITVAAELRRRGTLKRVGGEAYLHDLVGAVATPANASYYADIVHERALKRRLVAAGTQIVQLGNSDSGDTVDDVFARALGALTHARPDVTIGAAHPWAPMDLTEILEHGETIEQPTVLERTDGICLLYPGTVHSIAGEPATGKSWVALIGCAQELKAGAHVTFLDFEDRAGRVTGRLRTLGVPPDRIRERFHYIRPTTRLDAAGTQHIEHAATRSSLVVVDGVTEVMSLHGLDLNDQKDIAAFLALIPRRLADLGPAVLQIDHLPKATEHGNRFAIGGQHKLAGLDGAAYLVKVVEKFGRGKKGRAIVTVAKDREGAVEEHTTGNTIAELVIDATAGGWSATLEVPRGGMKAADGSFRPTVLMERVSRFVEQHPDQSAKQIEKNVPGKGTGIRDAIRVLVAEGMIEGKPGPHAGEYYSSVTPYRQDDDE